MTNDLMFDLRASGYLTRTSLAQSCRPRPAHASIGQSPKDDCFRICGNWVATAEAPLAGVVAVLHRGN